MDRDSLRTRGLRLAPVAWAAILPLLMLGPALGKGYVLSYDMVWVPDLSLRTDFLGLGTALPRAVPSDAIVAVLDELVPGMLLQKLVLYGGLVLAGVGYARMVRPAIVPRMVAVSLAVWNPFVVERLWIGHWPVLLGYAAVPWLVLAGRRIRLEHRIPISVWFLLPLGSLSASAGLVSALVVMVSALGRRPDMVAARLMAGCLAVNAPWLVAGLLHADDALGSAGAQVFGLRGEGSLPAPLSALGLGGIWNSEVVPAFPEGRPGVGRTDRASGAGRVSGQGRGGAANTSSGSSRCGRLAICSPWSAGCSPTRSPGSVSTCRVAESSATAPGLSPCASRCW